MTGTLYQEALLITRDYLGPAAERFIRRQTTIHLGKAPEDLSPEDIPMLVEWVGVSIAILTEDKKLVEDFNRRILRLER